MTVINKKDNYHREHLYEIMENISNKESFIFISKLYIIYMLIYFPMMTGIVFTIDSELNAVFYSPIDWLRQGRWTTYIVTYVLFPPIIPYFTIAFFGLLSAVSYTIFISACGLRRSSALLIGYAIFAGFPVWSALLEFPANTPAAGIALLLCAISSYGVQNNKPGPIIIRSILVAISIGAYQSFLFVYIAMSLSVLYFKQDNIVNYIYSLVLLLLSSIFSIIINYIITLVLLNVNGINISYITSFINFNLIVNDFYGVVYRSISVIGSLYAGRDVLFGINLWASSIIILISIIESMRMSYIRAISMVLILICPIPLIMMSGGWLPIRTLIATPIIIAFCSIVIIESNKYYLKLIGSSLGFILALQSISAISQYQAARELTAKFDQIAAGDIYKRIYDVSDELSPKTVDFFGALQPPQIYSVIPSSTAGASFFSWDGGNPLRIISYMKMLGFSDLNLASPETRLALRDEYAEMPRWPAPGSVRKAGDIILVKLGDQPGHY